MEKPVKLTAHYSQCCFCSRPELPDSQPFDSHPRFLFRERATRYAKQLGLANVRFNPKAKSALADMAHRCAHRDVQTVRIEWTLFYGDSQPHTRNSQPAELGGYECN